MSLAWKKRKKGLTAFLDLREPGTGKRHILSLDTRDPVEARRRYHLKAAEILSHPAPRSTPNFTLGDLQEAVLRYKAAIPSVRIYRQAFSSLLTALPAGIWLTEITRQHVDEWRARAEKDLKPGSVNTYIARLQSAFALAVEWEKLSRSPFKGVKPGRAPEGAQPFGPEVSRVFDALLERFRKGQMYRAAAEVAYFTGLRVGEVVQLRPEHVTDTHILVVEKTKSDRKRNVPLTDSARRALAVRPVEESPWFYPSPQRGPDHHLRAATLTTFFKIACRKAKVEGHFHMLRHSFAARHLSAGVSIYTVSKWLGHADVATTQRHYGHLVPGSQDAFIHLARDSV